jgi:hypothetical protein
MNLEVQLQAQLSRRLMCTDCDLANTAILLSSSVDIGRIAPGMSETLPLS